MSIIENSSFGIAFRCMTIWCKKGKLLHFNSLKGVVYDNSIFRQEYRQSIISRFSIRKWYVLGLYQKKNASLYTYTPTHANALHLLQMDNGS